MNLVRRAIESKLDDDATLLALLGSGTDASILGQYDITQSTAKPYLILRFDGSTGRSHFAIQTWTILCVINPNVDTLSKPSSILKKVKDALDFQFLSISTGSGAVCCESTWFMDIPTYYDALNDALVEGQRYHIQVRDV